jgi:pimeloyl-ACP methyl ester carboxylesterase
VELLRTAPGIDRRRVYVLGHSMGGSLAPRIAAFEGGVAGIVIVAGLDAETRRAGISDEKSQSAPKSVCLQRSQPRLPPTAAPGASRVAVHRVLLAFLDLRPVVRAPCLYVFRASSSNPQAAALGETASSSCAASGIIWPPATGRTVHHGRAVDWAG